MGPVIAVVAVIAKVVIAGVAYYEVAEKVIKGVRYLVDQTGKIIKRLSGRSNTLCTELCYGPNGTRCYNNCKKGILPDIETVCSPKKYIDTLVGLNQRIDIRQMKRDCSKRVNNMQYVVNFESICLKKPNPQATNVSRNILATMRNLCAGEDIDRLEKNNIIGKSPACLPKIEERYYFCKKKYGEYLQPDVNISESQRCCEVEKFQKCCEDSIKQGCEDELINFAKKFIDGTASALKQAYCQDTKCKSSSSSSSVWNVSSFVLLLSFVLVILYLTRFSH